MNLLMVILNEGEGSLVQLPEQLSPEIKLMV